MAAVGVRRFKTTILEHVYVVLKFPSPTQGNLNVLIKILKLKFSLFFVAESHS